MKYPLSHQAILEFHKNFNDTPIHKHKSAYWSNFLLAGSHLWMDTGDIEAAQKIWSSEFNALTTNNTLLNKEIQKGVYDQIIPEIAAKLTTLSSQEMVNEIALALNVLHGLRLVKIFNAKVSIELHTDLAHHIQGTIDAAKRIHSFAPDHFIIKIPFTASGLIAARKAREHGIPVNFTLDFSVRQNCFASVIANPHYSNVFMGRLGAYLKNNKLGNGKYIGEKVTLETQHCFRILNKKGLSNTRLIAASIRNEAQLQHLAGTDVFTIPTQVAIDAVNNNIIPGKSHVNEIPEPDLFNNQDINRLQLKKLWQVKHHEIETILHLKNKLPQTGEELETYAREHGCRDLFPQLNKKEKDDIKRDGKIPVHSKWENKITSGEIGIDTLLNLAGLYSFESDQQQLDKRIQQLLNMTIAENQR